MTQQQQPPAPPKFKSTTALVEVDAIILDKNGQFVPGLKAEDLELREEGKPQQIQQFYMVTHDRAQRSDLPDVAQLPNAQQAGHRVFVILFDEGHLANDSLLRSKAGAENFINRQLGPGDIGGIFVDGGMFKGRMTTDRAELLSGVRAVHPAFDNRQALLAPFREFPRIPSEVDATRVADGARELVDDLGTKACNEDPQACSAAGGLQAVENLIQMKSRLYVRQARMLTSQTLQNLRTVIKGLSHFPGRKTVVFMTEGFYVEESRSTLEQVSAQASRAGVTIYSIDGRGNINTMSANTDVVRMERARSTAFDTGTDGPTILTAGTGGFMVSGIDDMSRAFGLVVRDTSTYYVIGYQPANTKMDGKFRKIELKSKVPGLKIRARRGYAATELPPQDAIWSIK
ncbi:MAG: VWA domain-containing protein [Vicinamibacterales bacterium]